MKNANVVVRCVLDPTIGNVMFEEQSLKQVILNLARNAIEAVRSNAGGTLTVSTQPVSDKAAVALQVMDDGPGFDEKIRPCSTPSTPRRRAERAQGLAIVHRIVTEHGGTIGVKSKPGHTCFTIQLPQPAAPPARLSAPQ